MTKCFLEIICLSFSGYKWDLNDATKGFFPFLCSLISWRTSLISAKWLWEFEVLRGDYGSMASFFFRPIFLFKDYSSGKVTFPASLSWNAVKGEKMINARSVFVCVGACVSQWHHSHKGHKGTCPLRFVLFFILYFVLYFNLVKHLLRSEGYPLIFSQIKIELLKLRIII